MSSTSSQIASDFVDEAQAPPARSSSRSSSAVRHNHAATSVLKSWFVAHSHWPYPTQQDKDMLCLETGLSARQVSQWFVNARRRNMDKLQGDSPPPPLSAGALSVASRSAPSGSDCTPWNDMTPLDRWRNSPPDDEPAPLHSISRAVGSMPMSMPISPVGSPHPMYPGFGGPSSRTSSFDLSSSDGSSVSSVHSSVLEGSTGGRRRRRRLRRPFPSSGFHAPRRVGSGGGSRPYQCTFCTDTFKTRYDWTRHEATLHLVLEKWVCLPSGPRHADDCDGSVKCALCDVRDPSDAHLASHRATDCGTRPLAARSFLRKDHFRQHLRLVHGISEITPSMEAWKVQMTRIKSRCGFCGETFSTWPDRNDHLAEHFRSGTHMREWRGCRGLDPPIALLVQNAMPPYLIGIEATDPEPFSATRGTVKETVMENGGKRNAFETLTARLGEFVQRTRHEPAIITDDILRREARLILYGDDDPWNQTPADNDQWLSLFKLGYGLTTPNDEKSIAPGPTLYGAGHGTTNATTCSMSSPFTVERFQRAMEDAPTILPFHMGAPDIGVYEDLVGDNGSGVYIPWTLQSPECLAEFSQMQPLLPQAPTMDPKDCTLVNTSTLQVDSMFASVDIPTGNGGFVASAHVQDPLAQMSFLFDLDG